MLSYNNFRENQFASSPARLDPYFKNIIVFSGYFLLLVVKYPMSLAWQIVVHELFI